MAVRMTASVVFSISSVATTSIATANPITRIPDGSPRGTLPGRRQKYQGQSRLFLKNSQHGRRQHQGRGNQLRIAGEIGLRPGQVFGQGKGYADLAKFSGLKIEGSDLMMDSVP